MKAGASHIHSRWESAGGDGDAWSLLYYYLLFIHSFIIIYLFILNLLPAGIDYRWVQDRFPFLRSLKRTEFSVTLKHGQATAATLFLERTCAPGFLPLLTLEKLGTVLESGLLEVPFLFQQDLRRLKTQAVKAKELIKIRRRNAWVA